MAEQHRMDQLVDSIRQIYHSDRQGAEKRIEAFLESSLTALPGAEKLKILDDLAYTFGRHDAHCLENVKVDQEALTRIFSFLLGKKVSRAELSSDELLQRLADSLKTIFDMLNQLVGVINRTFSGEREGTETIRQMIGFHLEGDNHATGSLKSYLGQINKAFLTAQQAFKLAAEKKMEEILAELEPGRITAPTRGGLKFGSLRKAEGFDRYVQKYDEFKKWVNSGRYIEKLLREFEKNCQEIFNQQGGD